MDGPLTFFVVAVFGMIALVCLVSFPLLIYPPYTGPAVPPPGALPVRKDELEAEMMRLKDAGLIRQVRDEDDLLTLYGDPDATDRPVGVLRVKSSPFKIFKPEAN